ncbi:MAG: stage II sporulation protein E [Sarcina sp.]
MQYGANVKNYVRIKNKQGITYNEKTKENYGLLFFILAIGILLSRIVIPAEFTILKVISPFGVAYLLSFNSRTNKEYIIALTGVVIGYTTMMKRIEEIPIYIFSAFLVVAINYFQEKIKKKLLVSFKFLIVGIFILSYNMIVGGKDFLSAVVIAMMLIIFIIPSYFLLNYSIESITQIKSNHYFSSEEIFSIEILLALLIVGIGNITIFNISLKTSIAILLAVLSVYIIKSSVSVAAGLIIGLFLGITSSDFTLMVAVYGLSVLVATIFKEGGKFLIGLSFTFTYLLINFYSNGLNKFVIYDLSLAIIIFLFIPKNFLSKFQVELDGESKQSENNDVYFNKMKKELSNRLGSFNDVLKTMSVTLNNIVENEKLVNKNKGEALINNLADRVCLDCDFKKVCWKREMHETYSAFLEVIENCEEGKISFPHVLEKKCLKKATLIKVTSELVNNHVLQETVKERLGEGRKLLSSHLNNMSDTVEEIIKDFNRSIIIERDIEKVLRKEFLRNNVPFRELFCYSDKNGRLNIKLEMESCDSTNYCRKDLLPLINKNLGKAMFITNQCKINPKTNSCEINISEAEKFHVTSDVFLLSKDGEKYTGDSYSVMEGIEGSHIALLCDGMGSGARAGAESKVTVELMEKFSEVGFNEITAINTINSIMNIKFTEEEKFSTLDMQKIDLYTGEMRFIKVGAVESFIKRGNNIEIIESKTLPFGVLDEPDIDIIESELQGGEFIITISDGVLDVHADGNLDNKWIVNLLRNTKAKTAKALANEILLEAKVKGHNKIKDDMTVLVSKVYKIS